MSSPLGIISPVVVNGGDTRRNRAGKCKKERLQYRHLRPTCKEKNNFALLGSEMALFFFSEI